MKYKSILALFMVCEIVKQNFTLQFEIEIMICLYTDLTKFGKIFANIAKYDYKKDEWLYVFDLKNLID